MRSTLRQFWIFIILMWSRSRGNYFLGCTIMTNAAKLALEKILKKNVMVVGAGVKTGLNIRMDNPSSVGSDLIVGAVAGVAQYPVPLIIFDLGTANTVY